MLKKLAKILCALLIGAGFFTIMGAAGNADLMQSTVTESIRTCFLGFILIGSGACVKILAKI